MELLRKTRLQRIFALALEGLPEVSIGVGHLAEAGQGKSGSASALPEYRIAVPVDGRTAAGGTDAPLSSRKRAVGEEVCR